jgi:hypothetical protein
MRMPVRFAVSALLVAALVGCGGGNGNNNNGGQAPAAVRSLSRGVRVTLRLVMPAEAGYLNELTPAQRQEATEQGFTLRETEIAGPTTPAIGYFVKVGDRMIPSGPDGEFFLPPNTVAPDRVPLFKQLSDSAPLGEVTIGSSLRPGNEPLQTVVLELRGRALGSAQEMDGDLPGRSRGVSASCCKKKDGRAVNDGCPRVDYPNINSNVPGQSACYDYDLAKGRIQGEDSGEDDGDGDNEEGGDDEGGGGGLLGGFCLPKRLSEFYDTPCYQWTFGTRGKMRACINERAILQVTGPGCWQNHKYRFCQNLSMTDFSVSSTGTLTVTVGREVRVTVRNNTPSNETQLSQTGNANGTIELSDGVTQTQIKHYDDPSTTHIPDRTVIYKAPASLPDGQTEATDTLTFTANGMTKTLTIRVVQECQDNQGRAVPCK